MFFEKKVHLLRSSFFHFSEVAVSTSEKLCPARCASSTPSLFSPACLSFLATFFLKIKLLNDKIHKLRKHFTIQHTSNIYQNRRTGALAPLSAPITASGLAG